MTDDELIVWLRLHGSPRDMVAADRIEELLRERSEAVRQAVDYCDCHDFRDGGLELAVTEILGVLEAKRK